MVFKINKCGNVGICLNYQISAFTAITSVRAALWDILFTPETDTTVSAIAGLYKYLDFIYKYFELQYTVDNSKK
jgi:hypothetical protein